MKTLDDIADYFNSAGMETEEKVVRQAIADIAALRAERSRNMMRCFEPSFVSTPSNPDRVA